MSETSQDIKPHLDLKLVYVEVQKQFRRELTSFLLPSWTPRVLATPRKLVVRSVGELQKPGRRDHIC